MNRLIESQWHMVAAADDIIEKNGGIVGVIFNGITIIFAKV